MAGYNDQDRQRNNSDLCKIRSGYHYYMFESELDKFHQKQRLLFGKQWCFGHGQLYHPMAGYNGQVVLQYSSDNGKNRLTFHHYKHVFHLYKAGQTAP
jgi:hypothetical protein